MSPKGSVVYPLTRQVTSKCLQGESSLKAFNVFNGSREICCSRLSTSSNTPNEFVAQGVHCLPRILVPVVEEVAPKECPARPYFMGSLVIPHCVVVEKKRNQRYAQTVFVSPAAQRFPRSHTYYLMTAI